MRLRTVKLALLMGLLLSAVPLYFAFPQAPKKLVSGKTTVTAKTIEIDMEENTLLATGNCKLQSGEELRITSDSMKGSLIENEITTLKAIASVKLSYSTVNDKGEKRDLEGSCNEASWQSDREDLALEGAVQMVVSGGQETANLKADRVVVNTGSNSFVATGDCSLDTAQGRMTGSRMEGKLAAGDQAELTTTGDVEVTYTSPDSKGGNQPVTGTCSKSVWLTEGDRKNSMVLTGEVHLKIPAEEKATALEASKVEINLRDRTFAAFEKCKLTTEGTEMSGDRMSGDFNSGDQQQLKTEGNVRVTTRYTETKTQRKKDIVATGRRSLYDKARDLLTIAGDATIAVSEVNDKIKGARVNGDTVTINLKNKKITIDSDTLDKPTQLQIEGGQDRKP
ncbi:MAG: hypothetical protein HY318_08895 [Armatimonadetes bacterium]|nr:hypothetical protein [Armatimonadota bacterium]